MRGRRRRMSLPALQTQTWRPGLEQTFLLGDTEQDLETLQTMCADRIASIRVMRRK